MGIFSKKNESEDSMPENVENKNFPNDDAPQRSTRLPMPQTNLPTNTGTNDISQSSGNPFNSLNRATAEENDTPEPFGISDSFDSSASAFGEDEEDNESIFTNIVDEEDDTEYNGLTNSDALDDRLSSPDTVEFHAAGEVLDEEIPMPDEEELLLNSETSVLKKEKEPVLEILTPSITRRELRMNPELSNSSDDDAKNAEGDGTGDQAKKAKRSLFGNSKKTNNDGSEDNKEQKSKRGRKNKKDAKNSFDILNKNLLNPVEDADGEESEEVDKKKKKKSLSEMTFSDLLPSKKDKTEAKLPLGENILIDLMPQSHKTVVEVRQARKTWTGVFGAVVIGCLIGSGLSLGYNWQTQQKVQKEQVVQEELDLKIAQYAEVNQALQSEGAARDLLNTAAGNEIDWNNLITTIESNLPAGTRISSLTVVNGGTVEDEVSSAVTMNLTSDTTMGYSDALRAVEGINGVQKVEIGGLSMGGENQYVYAMSFTFDTSILTERFAIIEEAPAEDSSASDPAADPAESETMENGG